MERQDDELNPALGTRDEGEHTMKMTYAEACLRKRIQFVRLDLAKAMGALHEAHEVLCWGNPEPPSRSTRRKSGDMKFRVLALLKKLT